TRAESFSFDTTPPGGRDSLGADREARSSQLPVSEERQSISQIMRALEQRPSRTSYVVATAFAVAWAAFGVVLAFIYMPELQALVKQGHTGLPALIGLASFVVAPILFFYV